jgi:thiamine pyrophosphokinase
MHILLFANGLANRGTMVERVLTATKSPTIVCADGGAHHAIEFGYSPQTIIGDLDSVTPQKITDLEKDGTTILRYPAEKDETDLELALYWCAENEAKTIHIIGGLGGRFDQTLANIYLLSLPQLDGIHVEVIDAEQSIRLLKSGEHHIRGDVGDTISLLPISDTVDGITTTALKYPLSNESLTIGPARGVSNVMTSNTATIRINNGLLIMVHTIGRA